MNKADGEDAVRLFVAIKDKGRFFGTCPLVLVLCQLSPPLRFCMAER